MVGRVTEEEAVEMDEKLPEAVGGNVGGVVVVRLGEFVDEDGFELCELVCEVSGDVEECGSVVVEEFVVGKLSNQSKLGGSELKSG